MTVVDICCLYEKNKKKKRFLLPTFDLHRHFFLFLHALGSAPKWFTNLQREKRRKTVQAKKSSRDGSCTHIGHMQTHSLGSCVTLQFVFCRTTAFQRRLTGVTATPGKEATKREMERVLQRQSLCFCALTLHTVILFGTISLIFCWN